MSNDKNLNVHNPWDLAQMQSLPLEAKILLTKKRIEAWYESWTRYEIKNRKTGAIRFVAWDNRDIFSEPPLRKNEYIQAAYPGAVYVSFSGGKDSTVLKHIVDSMYDDVPSLFVNTGLEYPEIQKFAMSQKNVVTVRPEMRFDEVLKTYGYPAISKEVAKQLYEVRKSAEFHGVMQRETAPYNRKFNPESDYCKKYPSYCFQKWDELIDADFNISHMCCDVMKKKPAGKYEKETGRKPIVGTLATESRLRKTQWIRNGCNAFEGKRPTSQPLSFWTEQDILAYIKKYNLPYASVYGEIIETDTGLKTTKCERTGCVYCMFGCELEGNPNRFQRLKETHPRQYNYCINGGEMVDGKWQPNKEGLGLSHILDYMGVDYK